jgi:hypothetical protein
MADELSNLRVRLDKDQRTILDNISTKNFEECKKATRDSIERDRLHTTIVNMCAFAFSEDGPLAATGYHFITVEPLYEYRKEKGNKIFDLVIYNKEFKRSILIECKSSIGDPRFAVLNPLRDQIDTVVQHKKTWRRKLVEKSMISSM